MAATPVGAPTGVAEKSAAKGAIESQCDDAVPAVATGSPYEGNVGEKETPCGAATKG